MPYPHVPPDPDQPVPALRTAGLVVFSLNLKGMEPWSEQKLHTFAFNGKMGAVYMPTPIDAADPNYVYGGVGMGDLTGVSGTFGYKSTFDNGNAAESGAKTADMTTDNSIVTAKITTVKHTTAAGGRVSFAATYMKAPGGSSVVAVPYAEQMPSMTASIYDALHGHSAVAGTNGTATVKVTPSGLKRYVLFVANGLPGKMIPLSLPHVYDL